MKTPFLTLAAIPLLALCSCSSVKATAEKVKNSTSKTFAAAKEKTLGASEPKLRLTKANPSRFLPEGTLPEKIRIKNAPATPSKKETRLLAKHTPSKAGPSPSKPSSKKAPKAPPKKTAEPPRIELPPLPAASKNDNEGFRGILPSLDGSDDDTFIDIDGKALELPPMEFPVYEEEGEDEDEDEIDPKKSA